MNSYRILVVDDDAHILEVISTHLATNGYEIKTAVNYEDAVKKLNEMSYDLVITDISMGGHNFSIAGKRDTQGIDLLRFCKKNFPKTNVILITGAGTPQENLETSREGAYDYITKPFDKKKLLYAVQKSLSEREPPQDYIEIQNFMQRDLKEEFIFKSEEMQRIIELIKKIASSDTSPILIRGETGVGKEVIAKSIHNLSKRKNKPFLEINCTAIQEKLLENELFGHEKGAFTDAKELKRGLFEIASEGTLFLDEIGDINPNIQAKLLKVLESKSFFRLGGTQPITTDTRIIVATNKDLEKAIEEGTYREDLYYRLKLINIQIPPLRERIDDIIPLAVHFMQQFNKRFSKNFQDIHQHAIDIMNSYKWPGNIRELRNMMERIILLEDDTSIKLRHLPMEMLHDLYTEKKGPSTPPSSPPEPSPMDLFTDNPHQPEQFVTLEEMERLYIHKVLKAVNGNRAKASEILGIHRKTLWEKIKNDPTHHNSNDKEEK